MRTPASNRTPRLQCGIALTISNPLCRYGKSPEATPEGNTADTTVPEVVLGPLPESEKEDKPPSEIETDTEESERENSLSEGKEKQEEEEDQGASSALVSTTMPSTVQGTNEM